MRKFIVAVLFSCFPVIFSLQAVQPHEPYTGSSFKEEQKKNPRVRTAYNEKENVLRNLLRKNSIDFSDMNIFIRVFKKEAELELWASHKNESEFTLVKTYSICSSSGNPGPKRKGGDGQVPEGFYHIETFNPFSNFYLSLKVSYPNKSDRILGDKKNPGGDIFIHGNCVTIGCMPLTDDKIKEVYLLAVEAKNSGQASIPVHIFPCRLTGDGLKNLKKEYPHNPQLISFWKNLQQGFDSFEKEKKIPAVAVNKDGSYSFADR